MWIHAQRRLRFRPLESTGFPPGAAMRILLVEDDPMIGKTLQQALQQDGYAVDWVTDGAGRPRSRSTRRRTRYALVLLDLACRARAASTLLRELRRAGNQRSRAGRHRARRGGRPRRRARRRRRRLPDQAVQPRRAHGADARAAAPRRRARGQRAAPRRPRARHGARTVTKAWQGRRRCRRANSRCWRRCSSGRAPRCRRRSSRSASTAGATKWRATRSKCTSTTCARSSAPTRSARSAAWATRLPEMTAPTLTAAAAARPPGGSSSRLGAARPRSRCFDEVDSPHAARLAAGRPRRDRAGSRAAPLTSTARREVGELLDLQLKQLAYSTRIDDLLARTAVRVSSRGQHRPATGVTELVTQIWDRDGVLVYWSRPAWACRCLRPKGYSTVEPRRPPSGASTRSCRARMRCRSRKPMDEREAIATQTALRTLAAVRRAAAAARRADLVRASAAAWRPLDAMSRAVAKRRADAMAPLAERGVPEELQPLVGEPQRRCWRGSTEALAAQRRFTADAAHELRTPLAALKLQLDLARARSERRDGAGALDDLDAGVARASHVVEQLLTLARVEPEALAQQRSDCDLVGTRARCDRRARGARRRQGDRPRTCACRARDGQRRSGQPRDPAVEPARQCAALHAARRPHRRGGRSRRRPARR